jgi:Cytochrome P450
VVLQRKVLKPFTFSNGVILPTGTYLAAHLRAVHHDGSLYEDPEEFDGFRFFDEKPNSNVDVEKVVHEPRQPMYTTSKTYLPFSHGRHAWYVPTLLSFLGLALKASFSPGRFFASMELKLLMAYLLVNYDLKWPEEDIPSNLGSTEEGYRPPDRWFNFNCLPNQNAHMMVRKRV